MSCKKVVINFMVLDSRVWGHAVCGNLPHGNSKCPLKNTTRLTSDAFHLKIMLQSIQNNHLNFDLLLYHCFSYIGTYHITLYSKNSVSQTLHCNPFYWHFGNPALPVIISTVDLFRQSKVCNADCHIITKPVKINTFLLNESDKPPLILRAKYTCMNPTCSCELPGHDAESGAR